MANHGIKHKKTSGLPAHPDPSVVGSSDWNATLSIFGGTNGQLLQRDSAQADGWKWASLGDSVSGRLPFANIAEVAGFSVLGKATTGTGDLAAIEVAADRLVGRSGSGSVDDVQVVTNHITDKAVTLAKVQDIATARVLGRSTAGDGVIEVLSALPAVNGSALTDLTAANLTGTIASAVQDAITRLGTLGVAVNTAFAGNARHFHALAPSGNYSYYEASNGTIRSVLAQNAPGDSDFASVVGGVVGTISNHDFVILANSVVRAIAKADGGFELPQQVRRSGTSNQTITASSPTINPTGVSEIRLTVDGEGVEPAVAMQMTAQPHGTRVTIHLVAIVNSVPTEVNTSTGSANGFISSKILVAGESIEVSYDATSARWRFCHP